MTTENKQTVFIVDDDDAVRDSLLELFDSVGIDAQGYPSARTFLQSYRSSDRGCIVLDIRMPGMSGIELQQELIKLDSGLPVIFITGHGDVPMAVQAMKRGAVEFIQKPFRDQELLDCVQATLKNSQQSQNQNAEKQKVLNSLKTLTPREQQILDWIAIGHPNKVIALELGISQRTVENHRARLLEKMNTRSTAALIKLMMLASSV